MRRKQNTAARFLTRGGILAKKLYYYPVLHKQLFGLDFQISAAAKQSAFQLFYLRGVFFCKIVTEKRLVFFKVYTPLGTQGKHYILLLAVGPVNLTAVYHRKIVGKNTLKIFVQVEGVRKPYVVYTA